jgi:hypothetical protein
MGPLAVAAALLVLAFWWIRMGGDGWFYLATGRWIAREGELPSGNPFAFTTPAVKWLVQKWLAFYMSHVVERVSGIGGVMLVFSMISAGALTLCWWCGRGRSNAPFVSAALCILGLAVMSWRLSVRGETLALILLAGTMWIIERYRWSGGRTRAVFFLVPISAVWANVHGSFPLAGVLPALVSACELIKGRVRWQGPAMGSDAALRLGVIAIFSFLAMGAHPKGLSVIKHVLWQMGALHRVVDIWRPLDLQYTADRWAFLYMVVVVIGLVASPRRIDLTDLSILAPFGVQVFLSKRFVDPFVIISIPIAAQHWAEIIRLHIPRQGLNVLSKRLAGAALVLATAAGGLLLGPPSQHFPVSTRASGAVDYLLRVNPRGNLFNYYTWGGYVIWRGYPRLLVFIDGRDELYTNGVFDDYLRVMEAGPGWQEILDIYEVCWVLLPREAGLVTSLRESEDWLIAYEDSHASLFMRAEGAGQRKSHWGDQEKACR